MEGAQTTRTTLMYISALCCHHPWNKPLLHRNSLPVEANEIISECFSFCIPAINSTNALRWMDTRLSQKIKSSQINLQIVGLFPI